jgi:hypothetical protein
LVTSCQPLFYGDWGLEIEEWSSAIVLSRQELAIFALFF